MKINLRLMNALCIMHVERQGRSYSVLLDVLWWYKIVLDLIFFPEQVPSTEASVPMMLGYVAILEYGCKQPGSSPYHKLLGIFNFIGA